MRVVRQEGESFNSMWYRFKRQEKIQGFWWEIKKHRFYMKPSKKRRIAKKRGIFNAMLAEKRRKK